MKLKPSIVAIIVLMIAAIFFVVYQKEPAADNSTSDPSSQTTEQARTNRDGSAHHRPNRKSSSAELAQLSSEEKINHALGDNGVSVEHASHILLDVATDEKAKITVRNDALEHALNLVDDEDFDTVLDILAPSNKELPEPLVQTILDDTLNRVDTIQLDTSLLAMQGSHESIITEAKELLEFHLDKDLGDDVKSWKDAVKLYKEEQAKKEKAEVEAAPVEK